MVNPVPSRQEWERKLRVIVEMMREMSRHTDPQAMVRAYAQRMQEVMPVERRLSLSRRDLSWPWYRITRSTTWDDNIDPWQEKHRLPLLQGGLLAELIYGDEPRVIDDLTIEAHDPAAEYLRGFRSLLAVPLYDQGVALNMIILLRHEPAAFEKEQIHEVVWRSNLFGRATSNLVLKHELQVAYEALDRELKRVGDIQRSLLPAQLPAIATLQLAAYYRPAARAGGDYYDFFPQADGAWGLFTADVSGHGSPAAVLMAITHCIAHTHPSLPRWPHEVLTYLNRQLAQHYLAQSDAFVTGFYALYEPGSRRLWYASAGHPPPRLKRGLQGHIASLDAIQGLPLGLFVDSEYRSAAVHLQPGDRLVFYTDGITETRNPQGEMFGIDRLDQVIEELSEKTQPAEEMADGLIRAIEQFANGCPPDDDRTIVIASVT